MITDSRLQLSAVLRRARADAQLSLRELERRSGIDNAELSRFEAGRRVPKVAAAELLDSVLRTGSALRTLTETVRHEQELRRRGQVPQVLPPTPAFLVGREAVLARLDQHEGATIVLEGAAGTGKTALATYWVAADRSRWPGGILTSDLRGHRPDAPPATPGDVAADLLRGLGLPLPADEAGRIRALHHVLSGRRALVLLDDAITTEQVRPLLISGPSTIVITTRRCLAGLAIRDGAVRVAVPALAPATATQLLAEITGLPETTAQVISRACDYLPLALHAAAAALSDGRPLAAMVADLTGPQRLDTLTHAAADDPSAALRVVLAASVHRLSPPAQTCLRDLAAIAIDDDYAPIPFDHIAHHHTSVSEIVRHHLGVLTTAGLVIPGLVRSYVRTTTATDPVPVCA